MLWGGGWGGLWTTVDVVYGSNPLDPFARWDETMRPPLVNDPEFRVWRTVFGAAVSELLHSSWLVRWRAKSVTTALGVHLDAFGADLGFLRPDGWTNARYQAVLVPIDGVAQTNRTPPSTAALADGLAYNGQTWEMTRGDPLTYAVYFYGITDDEALTYYTVLDRGRPTAVRFVLAYSNVAKADTFVLDVSELDGTDILAKMVEL